MNKNYMKKDNNLLFIVECGALDQYYLLSLLIKEYINSHLYKNIFNVICLIDMRNLTCVRYNTEKDDIKDIIKGYQNYDGLVLGSYCNMRKITIINERELKRIQRDLMFKKKVREIKSKIRFYFSNIKLFRSIK